MLQLRVSGIDDDSAVSSDSEDELNLLKFFEQQKSSQNAEEVVVTAAKEMGKELYAHLSPDQRRDKLDNMVTTIPLIHVQGGRNIKRKWAARYY